MSDRSITISITSGTVVKALAITAAAAALFYLRNIALIVLTAIVIASAIEPGVVALMRRKLPRTLAVIAIYLLIFASLFVVFYFFLPSLLADFSTFAASLPSYLDTLTHSDAFGSYTRILGLQAVTADDLMVGIRSALDVGGAFDSAIGAATFIFGGVFSLILIIVFSFYFAVVETGVDDFLHIVSPRQHQAYMLGLWKRARDKIGLWMQGQILLAVIMGVLVFLGLSILQVKHALILACLAALFEIIPVFGPTLAAVPAVAIAFVDGGVTLGFLTVGLYVIAQQFENHLIYPLVVTRVVGVPPLLVILALICGGELAGFYGIILSVPIAAVIQELARDIESGRLSSEATKHHE